MQIAPLGVSRRVTPRALRAWRVIPLLAGIAELSEEIDVPRAERARESAAQRVAELTSGRGSSTADQPGGTEAPDVALREAEEALGRAELRLSVAGSHE